MVDGKLNENADPILLNLLGNLKYEPVKEILFNYAFSNIESDYHLQTQSILGLLNFECAEYLDIIKTNIENCLNKNLFPEFVPALVCKLSDRTEILEQLYITGDSIASTDCNAGIILGFSLCGDDGKKHFKKALFNPNWETYSSSTGTVGYTYDGLNNLKISFSELYEEIKNLRDEKEISYSLDVFFSLLDIRIRDYEIQSNETFNDLYLNLFSWETSNNSNNLINLARIVELENRAHEYKRKIELKMTEEIIIQNYSS